MKDLFDNIKFDDKGLVCVIAQDVKTGVVLMQAYANKEALRMTIETGFMHYYSRSRQCLWFKGETSGHVQKVCSLVHDCDGDAILARVEQTGVACHTGAYTCFFDEFASLAEESDDRPSVIEDIYEVIAERKENPVPDSYTNYLFDKGIDKILKKVAEECAEVVIASKNPDDEEVVYESADLIYHLLVLLAERGIEPNRVFAELASRRTKKLHHSKTVKQHFEEKKSEK